MRVHTSRLTLDPNYCTDEKMMQREHQIVGEHRYVRVGIDLCIRNSWLVLDFDQPLTVYYQIYRQCNTCLFIFGLNHIDKVDGHVKDRIEEKSDEVQHTVVNIQADTAFTLKV